MKKPVKSKGMRHHGGHVEHHSQRPGEDWSALPGFSKTEEDDTGSAPANLKSGVGILEYLLLSTQGVNHVIARGEKKNVF